MTVNKVFLCYLIFVINLFNVGLSSAVVSATDCFHTGWPDEKSDLEKDSTLQRGVLDNGFRYIVKHNEEPEDRVALYLYVNTGSLSENDNQQGVAHLLEHLLFNGTTHFPPGKLIEFLERNGLEYGGDTNAHTTYDQTVYQLILPKGNEETVAKGLLVMRDFARGALLLDSEITRERSVVLAEKRSRDSADYRAYVASTQTALAGTKLADRMVIGKEEVIKQADSRLLRSFYDTWYRPENMVLVMVGDVQPELAERMIIDEFNDVVSPPLPKDFQCPEYGSLSSDKTTFLYHPEPELGNTHVSLETLWDIKPENDSVSVERRELLRYLGSMIISYRLRTLQQDPHFPLTRAAYYYGDTANRVGYVTITGVAENDSWQDGLDALLLILRQVERFGVDDGELAQAKQEIIAQLREAVLTEDSVDSRTIGMDLIAHFNGNRVYQSPQQELELYQELLRGIESADVTAEYRKLWAQPYRFVSIVGAASLANGSQTIRERYEHSLAAEIVPPKNVIKVAFPYLPLNTGKSVPVQVTFPEVGVERYVFENGLVLNLKKTEFEGNKFQATARFGSGRLAEPAPGMSLVVADVVNDSGTGTYDAATVEKLLAGSSISLRFSVLDSTFGWSGGGLFDEFELFMQHLQSRLIDPGFRENIVKVTRSGLASMYKTIENSVEGAAALEIQRFLASNDPYFGLPLWLEVKDLDEQAMYQWFENSIRYPKNLEISVVGDIDVQYVVSMVDKYLGGSSWGQQETVKPSSVQFPSGEIREVEVKTSVDKTLVSVAWPTDDFWEIHRTRKLQMLATIFEDRLRKTLRETLGLAYAPSVSSYTSKEHAGYGYIMAQVVVPPEAIARVGTEIHKLAQQLGQGGISEEELARLREPMLTILKDTVQSNAYWLHSVLAHSSRFPQLLEWPSSLIEDYRTLGVDELSVLARRYLLREKAATVRIMPLKNAIQPQ